MNAYVMKDLDKDFRKCLRKVETLQFLKDYLPSHVGESFTIADLRDNSSRNFSPSIAAYYLSFYGEWFGVALKINTKFIKCDPPVIVGERVLDGYIANVYTIEKVLR